MGFTARYDTTCSECLGRIREGDLITRTEADDGWMHLECPDDPAVTLRPSEEVCTTCWLVKPCGCEVV